MNSNNYTQYRNQNRSTTDNMNQNTNANQNVMPQTGNLPVPIRPSRELTPQIPAAPPGEQAPQTVQSVLYTPGYLKTQIGRTVRVEFLIGTNGLNDRIGTLLGVGASYILIRPIRTNDILLCDIYSIKFVTIYYKPLE